MNKNTIYTFSALAVILSLQTAIAAPDPDGPTYEQLLKRVEQLEKNQRMASDGRVEHKMESDAKGSTVVTYEDNSESGYYVQAEAAVTQPIFSRNSAYLFQDDLDNVSDVEFDFDFDVSPRIEFGYLAPTSQLGWRARYWHYETDASAPLQDPEDDAIAIEVGGSVLEDVDTITSNSFDIEMDILDLEITQQIQSGLISYGLRAQRGDQGYNINTDEGILDSSLETTLFGPTAAIEFNRPIGDSDFSLYGNLRVAALAGQREISSTSPVGNFNSDDTFVTVNGVLGGGVIWEPSNLGEQLDGFYMSLGLEASYWSSAGVLMNNNVSNDDDLDDIIGGSSQTESDIATLGFILGVGWEW